MAFFARYVCRESFPGCSWWTDKIGEWAERVRDHVQAAHPTRPELVALPDAACECGAPKSEHPGVAANGEPAGCAPVVPATGAVQSDVAALDARAAVRAGLAGPRAQADLARAERSRSGPCVMCQQPAHCGRATPAPNLLGITNAMHDCRCLSCAGASPPPLRIMDKIASRHTCAAGHCGSRHCDCSRCAPGLYTREEPDDEALRVCRACHQLLCACQPTNAQRPEPATIRTWVSSIRFMADSPAALVEMVRAWLADMDAPTQRPGQEGTS